MLIINVARLGWTLASRSILSFFIIINVLLNIQASSQQQQQQQHKQQKLVAEDGPSKVVTLYSIPNLPPNHYRFWLKNHPIAFKTFQQICLRAPNPLQIADYNGFIQLHQNVTFEDLRYLADFIYGRQVLHKICSEIKSVPKACWGYEKDCHDIYLMPDCSRARDEQEQKIKWFSEADFGYILDRRLELNRYCSPNKAINDSPVSSFECTKNFRVCRGENLYVHFNRSLETSGNENLRNLITRGNLGGWNCDLQQKRILEENGLRGNLQSWFNELEHYSLIHNPPGQLCELPVDLQAFLIKFDASESIYDFFSNFVNLYATMHLNNKFSDNNVVLVWDEQPIFGENFKKILLAFSRYTPISITQYYGKRVCFKKFIFALPPITNDGLLHKSSFATGCSKSGLIDAFSNHILHRLSIPQTYDAELHRKLIRVTLLSRNSTQYRAILNERELKEKVEAYSRRYFINIIEPEEIAIDHLIAYASNTDILIGMHGSGLTSTLFLPKWASVIELYDCGDSKYANLARLRGVDYVSGDPNKLIEKLSASEGGTDAKKSNYRVNEDEFIKLIELKTSRVLEDRDRHFPELTPLKQTKPSEPVETAPTSEPSIPTPLSAGSTMTPEAVPTASTSTTPSTIPPSKTSTSTTELPVASMPVTESPIPNSSTDPPVEKPAAEKRLDPSKKPRKPMRGRSILSKKIREHEEL